MKDERTQSGHEVHEATKTSLPLSTKARKAFKRPKKKGAAHVAFL